MAVAASSASAVIASISCAPAAICANALAATATASSSSSAAASISLSADSRRRFDGPGAAAFFVVAVFSRGALGSGAPVAASASTSDAVTSMFQNAGAVEGAGARRKAEAAATRARSTKRRGANIFLIGFFEVSFLFRL